MLIESCNTTINNADEFSIMFKRYRQDKGKFKLKKHVIDDLKQTAIKKVLDLRQKAKLIDERIE